MSRINGFWVLALAMGLWLTACGPGGSATPPPTTVAQGSKPTLVVSAPAEGSLFGVGSTVSIKSTATDARGIVKVELWVDGVLYRVDITKEGESLPSVSLTQTWPANDLGNHVLLLKSINRDGAASDPQTINISVVPQSVIGSPSPSATRTPAAATLAPTGIPTVPTTPVPAATTVAACDSDAVFVSDVTVPDGTAFKPGDAINKVWRLRNAGTCAWGAGYQLGFVDGAQMGASSPVAVAATASSASADIAVNMTAPRTPGTYTGKWRMRSPAGALFGQSVSIVVKVIDTTPSTPTPTTTPGSLAADFSATRTTIPYADCVTLKWDVDNAAAVKLDGNGVVGHDTRLVCPQSTKEYVLEVIPNGGGDSVIRSITVTVVDPLKAASAVIAAGDAVNLSNGVKNGLGVDFKWTGDQTLTPQPGATFARIGIRSFTDVQQDECLTSTAYSTAALSAGQVAPGTVLCYKATTGHSGKMRISPIDSTVSPTSLLFQWVTW